MTSIPLSQMKLGYDGNPQHLKVSSFSPEIHDQPGLYLELIEGCGYTVIELTLDEAKQLSKMLIEVIDETHTERTELE
jgi:hypothetical protein